MRVITFKIDDNLLEMVDQLASLTKKSRSTIIREALEDYVITNLSKHKEYKLIIIHTPR